MALITIKNPPDDINKFVLKVQGEIKTARGCGMFSKASTIVHIIRQYKMMIEQSKKPS